MPEDRNTKRNDKLNASKKWLRENYLPTLDKTSEIYKHVATVAGLGLRGGKTGLSPTEKMRKLLIDTKVLDEYFDVYLPYKWGTPKMRTWVREQVRNKTTNQQLFIKYYATGSKQAGFGVYRLEGQGTMPDGWGNKEGEYLPIEMIEEF